MNFEYTQKYLICRRVVLNVLFHRVLRPAVEARSQLRESGVRSPHEGVADRSRKPHLL